MAEGFSARVLADSISALGVRLTTLEVTLPRIVLAELNTHRMFSRNSASSRAIPVEKVIDRVKRAPFVPEAFGENQRGMQSGESLDETRQIRARMAWLLALERAVDSAEMLVDVGVHKQWANRLLEPFMWQTCIVSATDWSNFFKLRLAPEAQPEIRRAAELMKQAMDESLPSMLLSHKWHLPLVSDADIDEVHSSSDNPVRDLCMVSAGRCARVSYLTHDGRRDLAADVELAERLSVDGHWSPFEHVARPGRDPNAYYGNFRGWTQFRKILEGTSVGTNDSAGHQS
jgi:thymidylate synthase ThyX